MSARRVVLITHFSREVAQKSAEFTARALLDAGLEVVVPAEDSHLLGLTGVVSRPDVEAAAGAELVVVLGGDGSVLRAAEVARPHRVPLVGVNLGHVGFLAEAEERELASVVEQIVDRRWSLEERMTVDAIVRRDGEVVAADWAFNEVSVEKADRQRMLEVVIEVDDRPLSRWGCDGVVFATPTGSTAYAFSAGGPVVWPEVAALLLVPISAHALFARPLVTSPDSLLALEIVGREPGLAWFDGRRSFPLEVGDRVEVRRGASPVLIARLAVTPFTDRLVAKFSLPVQGWRGRRSEPRS